VRVSSARGGTGGPAVIVGDLPELSRPNRIRSRNGPKELRFPCRQRPISPGRRARSSTISSSRLPPRERCRLRSMSQPPSRFRPRPRLSKFIRLGRPPHPGRRDSCRERPRVASVSDTGCTACSSSKLNVHGVPAVLLIELQFRSTPVQSNRPDSVSRWRRRPASTVR